MNIGWECPVCHKGNAPSTPKCLHCAEAPQYAPMEPVFPMRPVTPAPAMPWPPTYIGDEPPWWMQPTCDGVIIPPAPRKTWLVATAQSSGTATLS